MKKLFFLLAVAFTCATTLAQTVTIRFDGAANNNANNNKEYTVDLDGKKYYSNSVDATGNGVKQITIDDLVIGSHEISVYDASNAELYSKSFQLRTGYDLVIAIRRNGSVTFTEKKMKPTAANQTSQKAITDAQFNTLLTSIKAKWSQTSRISAIKTAIDTKSNYFTTEQVGDMLQLVTVEARRLELAKLAYAKVIDPLNYMDIAELFTTQTNKDNLVAYVQAKNPDVYASGQVSSSGQYASRIAMSDANFNTLYRKAQLHLRQTSVVADVKAALSNSANYFTQEQIRSLISLLGTEADRLSLMKLAYHRSADPTNFTQLYDLFSTQASITAMNTYIRQNPS